VADPAERVWRDCVESLGAHGNGLDDVVDGLWAQGRATHGFEVSRLAFVERLSAAVIHRAGSGAESAAERKAVEVHELATDDLYLAAGIIEGVGAAVAAARSRFGADLTRIMTRLVPDSEHDDTRQRLETHLFVGRGDAGPALASYRGSGSLASWVRAVGTRFMVDDTRARARVPAQTEFHSQPADAVPSEAELAVAAQEHADAVRAAMEVAFSKLTVRERNLIRYSVFHGLGVDELGALYAVHRSTAARWLQRARGALSEHVEDNFAQHLGASTGEAGSLLRALRSRLDVSIRSFLASTVETE